MGKKRSFIIPASENIKIYHDMSDSQTADTFVEIMNSNQPMFLSRLGGSDYECVLDYYNDITVRDDEKWLNDRIEKVKQFNGYFDFTNDREKFLKYLEILTTAYKDSDAYTYANSMLIGQFACGNFALRDAAFLNDICQYKTCINYDFIEFMNPFLSSLDRWTTGKKILIISPLAKSLEYQYKNKDFLYHKFKFPDFELLTYNTKITYSNASSDNKNTLGTRTNDWISEAEAMSDDISKIDFDIALLSCGSYAMFLGDFIKKEMKKKSLYLGGILNMYFNIYGGRFSQEAYQQIYKSVGLNQAYQINPIENQDIRSIMSGRGKSTESISAYFGYGNTNG